MEAVIFCGPQASGKSSFYQERFFSTHVRINLDMLRTRRREQALLQACLQAGQRFAVDNTNPTVQERSIYIEAARAAHFTICGYVFAADVADCLRRNAMRTGKARIPDKGVAATFARFEPVRHDEGFDRLFQVRLTEEGFVIDELPR
jgi:predicted kinase